MNLLGWFNKPRASVRAVASAFEMIVDDLAETPPRAAVLVHPANPDRGSRLQYIGPNNAGVRVTHDLAMMVSAVWACIDIIAATLASSDWNVYAGVRGSSTNKNLLENDNLQYLLNTRPNKEMTAQSFKRALGIAAVGYGNGLFQLTSVRNYTQQGLAVMRRKGAEFR